MSATAADALFDRDGWWNPACREFASLRAVSTFRLELLDQWLGGDWRGRAVVDLGCGGGLLGVPLARRGARVIGVDLAATALQAARGQRVAGFLGAVGELAAAPITSAQADVLEHVDDPAAAVAEAARLLRPGGHLFVNTIDRTVRSRLFAIWLGEGLGFIPRGTHRWHMFVRPSELEHLARRAGLRCLRRVGEAPRLWATLRTRAVALRPSRSTAVGYAMLFVKEGA